MSGLLPFGAPPDKWKIDNISGQNFYTPKKTGNHLIVGTTNDASGLTASLGTQIRAMFIDDSNGGIGYFTNTAYGYANFIPLGGDFIAGHAGGTAAAPVATTAGSLLGFFGFLGHDDTAWTINSTAYFQYALPGFYGENLTQPSGGSYDFRGYLGGLLFEAFTWDMLSSTGASIIYINRGNTTTTTTIGSAAGTATTIDGTTGYLGQRIAPLSTVDSGGSFAANITTVSSTPYAVADTDFTILVDATSGNTVINLPAVAGINRRIYNIKKIDSSAHTVTVTANGAETIDGSNTFVISSQYASITIQNNASAWYII